MSHEAAGPYHLGVDLGTTFTAAAAYSGGDIDVVDLGNRSTSMPSVVFLSEDGEFAVGETAERRAHTDPGRVAREFKRRLGDPTPVVLGGAPCSADLLTGELLRVAVATAAERRGAAAGMVALTHPASWGPYKLDLLRQAGRIAECGDVVLVSEPEAAVMHYSSLERVEPGAIVAVYDFGGGTFDAAVVRKTTDGVEILGRPTGLDQLGGVDFDQEVLRFVLTGAGEAVQGLDHTDPMVQAALVRLREDCRDAKEGLSMVESAAVPVMLPGVQVTAELDRASFEEMIRPSVERTIATLRDALDSADVHPDDLHAVVLAGGSSRIPLVQAMVAHEIARPVALDAHPKYLVAMGAARAAAMEGGETIPEVTSPPVVEAAPVEPVAAVEVSIYPDADDGPAAPVRRPVPPPSNPAATVFEVPAIADNTQVQPVIAPVVDLGRPEPGREPPPVPPQSTDGSGGRPWLLLGLAALLFAAIVGAFVLTGGGDDPTSTAAEGEQEPAEPEATPAEPTPEQATPEEQPTPEQATPEEQPTPEAEPTPEGETATPPPSFDPVLVATLETGPGPMPVSVGGDFLWVPNSGADTVTRIDPNSGETFDVVVGARPDRSLVAAGALWVPVRDGGELARIDVTDSSVISTPVGRNSDTPILAGGFIWLPVWSTNELAVIDPTDNSIVQTIAVPGTPLTPTVVGQDLWFTTRDGSAHVIDLGTFDPTVPAIFDTVTVGGDPRPAVGADGLVWVATRELDEMVVIDPIAQDVVARIGVGERPGRPTAGGGRMWVSSTAGETVSVIDIETRTLETEIDVGQGPRGLATVDNIVIVAVADANAVVLIDATTAEIVADIASGAEPDTPALVDDRLWIPNFGDGTVFEVTLG